MMDPEILRIAQEQMSRMSPEELARIQQQMMSNPDLIKMASEGMSNMRPEDFKQAAEHFRQTRPEDLAEMSQRIANAKPEDIAAMKAQADARISYVLAGAKMLKQQGNELHSRGQYQDAANKYLVAKNNLKDIRTLAAKALQMQCSVNLMSCYLKTRQFAECIQEGSEVLASEANNIKALYRRGQAYKELGKLENAFADLNNAHEICPDDETIAAILGDVKENLLIEKGKGCTSKCVVIDEIVEAAAEPSNNQDTSSNFYSVSHPNDAVRKPNVLNSSSKVPITSDSLSSSRVNPPIRRPLQRTMSDFGMQGLSPDLVKTATDMISTMKPEELQKMFQVASQLNDNTASDRHTGSSNMPEMSPEMVKIASDMINKMSPNELQDMLNVASSFGGSKKPSSTIKTSDVVPSGSQSSSSFNGSMEQLNETETRSDGPLCNQATSNSFLGVPSTADMQQVRNSMTDPAMQQMFTSMMKNMNPEMMANVSKQLGINLSKEDAVKAQQAMASLSPEDLDRMIKWADRAQKAAETAKKTKNWLLGRPGLIFAIVILILAFILQHLGVIGG